MDISFATTKFRKECNDQKTLTQRYGTIGAKRLRARLDNLRAADTLEAMRNLPGRCHELTGDRTEQLALDLNHPYRLVFMPANDPIPRKGDGGLDWSQVTAVRLLGVEDYHG